MPDPPNILFIFTDQQFADMMSCVGNSDLHTPAMDSLAARGVRFEQAYCTQPLCTPSRASLMTGRHPHELGITGNGVGLSDAQRAQSMGNLLSSAGYRCAYAGKWHLPKNTIADGHGFESLCGQNDHQIAPACAEFLNQSHDRPFLLVASFDNPHNICEWARGQPLPWATVDRVPPEQCPALPANFAVAPYAPQMLEVERQRNPFFYPTEHYTLDDWRQYRHAYCRLVEAVDREVGRILDALRAAGLEERTMIVFSSDHGDGNAAHQRNQKQALYEESVRIPLIIQPPGGCEPAVNREHLVSNGLDLLPTFCDYASVAPPADLPGRSLRPLVERGAADDWRDELVIETKFQGDLTQGLGRALRTGRYKYTVYAWGSHREQLIDLERDPGEMVNLAVQASHRAVLDEHRQRLARWGDATGDRFPYVRA